MCGRSVYSHLSLIHISFEMVAMEKKVSEEITIQTGQGPFTLRLGGTIDRMDAKDVYKRQMFHSNSGSIEGK